MGWNTSFPAEYLLQANSKDYKQTLAYSEELRQRQELLNPTDTSSGAGMSKSPAKNAAVKGGYFPRSTGFSNTTTTATTRGIAEVGSAQCEEERTLLKNTMLREGLLAKLYGLIKAATPPLSMLQPHLPPKEPVFDVAKGTEVLHLLLQLRDVGVLVVESIMRWHELRVRLAPMVPLAPFRFENHNYCIKMLSDLNFLSTIKTLGSVLGVNPSTMKQNPFMMPAPISERNFQGLREKPWRSLRLFDPPAPGPPSPTRSVYGSNSPSSSSLHKNEQQQKVTWQKRAEKQLELLSMPLESLSGPTMCAWVFSVLRVAQQQDYERLGLHTSSGLDSGGDEDRLELLSELEVDAAASPQPSKDREESEGLLPPLSRSRSGKRVSIGNAEVLFINENQPVMMTTPRASSRSSSRRSESPASSNRKNSFTVTSLHSAGESNALLRTSPWTYRGVVYFVSFFLQQEKERPQQQQEEEESADEAEQRRLMIKIYEPMSSVESQMSVDTEDLRQDFGEQALGAFQSGQYRTLCDLMLQQLDGMMGTGTKSAPPTPPQPRKDTSSTATEELPEAANKNESLLLEDESGKQANALDLLLQDSDGGYDDRRHERPEIVDEPTAEEPAPTSLDLEILEASAVRIQCAARQQQARGNVNRIRAQKKQAEAMEASALRIQCAARQNQARVKVDRARAEKTRVEDMEASALRIQCTARQKQARLKVDRVRAEKKQVESMEASALRIQCVARQKQARLKVDRVRVEKMQQQVDAVPETDVDEDDSEEAPTGEHGSKDADEVAVLPPESRPGTVMSYASDQFEDDARDSELDAEAD
ncbi:hypothetical protein PF008_g15771 [Phytophthora fragariae]|uniref:Dynein heavy chain coiled coil stalk domain-containing protein n=1 Tax=Phytophthora fragariae TaxID=53985 RepID=A0A6G0RD66_9STRA|nr:hypothetical protein PF008_g15771 [Phytophthora fragariae]